MLFPLYCIFIGTNCLASVPLGPLGRAVSFLAEAPPQFAKRLGDWPPEGRWYTMAAANLALNLPDGTIRDHFCAEKRDHGWKRSMEYLRERGVWKHLVKNREGRQWWIAFAGVGSEKPHFDSTAKEHTFCLGVSSESESFVMSGQPELRDNSTSSGTDIIMSRRCGSLQIPACTVCSGCT